MLCAVCTSRTCGFGWFDPHRPRPHRTRRWFWTNRARIESLQHRVGYKVGEMLETTSRMVDKQRKKGQIKSKN